MRRLAAAWLARIGDRPSVEALFDRLQMKAIRRFAMSSWRPSRRCERYVNVASQPPEPPRLQLEEFQQLRQYVNENSGIALSTDSRLTVERKLGERVQALGLPGFREYCTYLRTHPQRRLEIERAVELLTTNETYFFREMTQLRAFEQRGAAHAARDCARAPADADDLERGLLDRRRGVHARDPASKVGAVYGLGRARDRQRHLASCATSRAHGRVSRVAASARCRRSTSEYFLETPDGSRRFEPSDPRHMCQFGHFNLLDALARGGIGRVDAVFCRNVLIYFDQASRRQRHRGVLRTAAARGYLMLGHSESLLQ